jgi:hypothetical protein
MAHEHAVEEYGMTFYQSVYQDGTHSLAAVGMVAPLMETVFVRLLDAARKMVDVTTILPLHARWCVVDKEGKRWNCKYRWSKSDKAWKDDLVNGIEQFLKALHIETFLGHEDRLRLKTLFQYRNNMFHNGMEWPEEKRASFMKLMKELPPQWLQLAESGGRPWMFYMTASFVDGCLDMLERFVDSVGALFLREHEHRYLSLDKISIAR